MIDRTGIVVSDFEQSKSFYAAALKPIALLLIAEYSASTTGSTDIAGFGQPPEAELWLTHANPGSVRVHVAFRVHNHAAFVLDPDGYNIEAVCHEPK
ncbi:MAG: VOC family protein [Nostoc sp.]|uniref:VOC family protein n=1 Tax=Nostoc sp. TaxID=1180 RepID=UPI002FFBBAF8